MKYRDVIRFSGLNALRRKTKSVLTALSITIGIAAVFLVTSISSSGEMLIMREIDKLGLQGITIHQSREKSSIPLTDWDVKLLKNRFKQIESAFPIIIESGTYRLNKSFGSAVVFGVGDKADTIYNVSLLYGRIPNSTDISSKASVAVIDDELANRVYRRENIVGKQIVLKIRNSSKKVRIVGVIKSQKDGFNQLAGNNIPDFIYLPYTTLNDLRGSDNIDQIAIKCFEDDTDETEFSKYLSTVKSAPNGYIAENMTSKINEIKSITNLVSLLISAIAAVALCVAGLGIMNTAFSSASERRNEIGICLAIGAGSGDILKCFLTESIIIAVVGGTVGSIIGYSLTYCICKLLNLSFIFSFKKIIMAQIISVIFGGAFSIMPAIKISKLNPIEALRQ